MATGILFLYCVSALRTCQVTWYPKQWTLLATLTWYLYQQLWLMEIIPSHYCCMLIQRYQFFHLLHIQPRQTVPINMLVWLAPWLSGSPLAQSHPKLKIYSPSP